MSAGSRAVLLAWFYLVAHAAFGTAAHADRAVLLPQRTPDASAPAVQASRAALAEALTMQGLNLVDFEAARRRLGAGSACALGDCGHRILEAELADVAATVTVRLDDAGTATRVFVTLTDRARELYEAEATVRDGEVRAATTRALLEARSLQLLGPGPWLRVDGAPDGAEVFVDGRRVGTVPYRGHIEPGSHVLRVQADGYEPMERTLDVSAAGARKIDTEAVLRPGALVLGESSRAQAVDEPSTEERGLWRIAGPLVLGGAGVALAAVTTVRLASGLDSCVNADAEGRCTERRTVQVAPTVIYYSLSAALIGGAVVWWALGSQQDDAPVALGVGPSSAAVFGHF